MQNQIDKLAVSQTLSYTHTLSPIDCGTATFTVFSCTPTYTYSNFLTITGTNASVSSNNVPDANTYNIVLTTTLVKFPEKFI